MTPTPSIGNIANVCWEKPKLFSNLFSLYSHGMEASNFNYFLIRKHRVPALCAFYERSLADGVAYIVNGLANKKMIWINATRIVSARAVMAHKIIVWYEAFTKIPRNPVGAKTSSVYTKKAVTFWRQSSIPNPTRIGFLNLGKESGNDGFLVAFRDEFYKLVWHLKPFLLGVKGPAVSAAGSVYFCTSA